MNVMNKLIAPSVTRSIVYPILAAASMFIVPYSSDSLMNESNKCALQYKVAVQSNTNLEKVVDIDNHLALDHRNQVNDSISKQLQDEKRKLLSEPKTREGYKFITDIKEKQASYDLSFGIRGAVTGAVTAAFAMLGYFTIWNTVVDWRKRKQQRNA